MQFEAENSLIGVKALSEYLEISLRTLRRILASGELPSILIGRRRLVRKSALVAWLASLEQIMNDSKGA